MPAAIIALLTAIRPDYPHCEALIDRLIGEINRERKFSATIRQLINDLATAIRKGAT